MSQTPIYERGMVPKEMQNKTVIEVNKETLEATISYKNQKSLSQYLQFYSRKVKLPNGQIAQRNAAALLKKYDYLLKLQG